MRIAFLLDAALAVVGLAIAQGAVSRPDPDRERVAAAGEAAG